MITDTAVAVGFDLVVREVNRLLSAIEGGRRLSAMEVEALTLEWVLTPVGALGFKRPVAYLGSTTGSNIVIGLLRQMTAGSYA